MSKLLKLKRFFTLKEAGKYLSSAFEETSVAVRGLACLGIVRNQILGTQTKGSDIGS
jgi:hypothetical protein